MISVYFYTLYIAFFSTLIAFLVGFVCAYFTSHKSFFGKKIILCLYIIPLCLPPLIIALGYVSFFGVNGSVNNFFGTSRTYLYSSFAIIVAQGFYNFPFVTKIIHDAWTGLPRETQNAARILGAKESRVFFTITIKELSGAICASVIPVFLFCFFSFLIAILFSPSGKSTLEVELYRMVRSSLDFSSATKLILLETFTALIIVIFYSLFNKKGQIYNSGISFVDDMDGKPYQGDSSLGTKWLKHNQGDSSLGNSSCFSKAVFLFLIFLIIFFLICPLFSIIKSSFTQKMGGINVFSFKHYIDLLKSKSYWLSSKNSFIFSLFSSFFCCLVSFLYASLIRINKKQTSLVFSTIPLLPMAISSVAISYFSSLIFHKSNVVVLVLLQVIMFWPLSYRQIQNALNRINQDTQKAASIFSKNKLDILFRIYLPSCKKVLISAFCLNFAICIGDTTLPLVLSIQGFNNVALQTYRLSGSYRYNAASASAVLLILSGIIFVLLVTLFLRVGRKLFYPNHQKFYK